MHLVIAIPTLNRCKYLKNNIHFFDQQRRPANIRVSLAISNSASVDGTESFLSELQNSRTDLFLFNRQTGYNGSNYGYLCTAIPDDADWVWFMGDDDYLYDSEAIASVCEVLTHHHHDDQFAFLHACQARRSRNTRAVTVEDVSTLCNMYGYTEMLGWISSIVMRKDLFINALKKTHERGQLSRNDHALGVSHSAFFQASYFYEELHMKKGAFLDKQLVEPQDEEMTEETRERWQAENMGERYIYIVDDLERLEAIGISTQSLQTPFFKYHNYHLWDRFMIHQINVLLSYGAGNRTELIQQSIERFGKNWERIQKIPKLLADPAFQKQLYLIIENNIGLCNLYLESNFDKSVAELLQRQRDLHSVEVFDFCIA